MFCRAHCENICEKGEQDKEKYAPQLLSASSWSGEAGRTRRIDVGVAAPEFGRVDKAAEKHKELAEAWERRSHAGRGQRGQHGGRASRLCCGSIVT